jgi:hypothetical protein
MYPKAVIKAFFPKHGVCRVKIVNKVSFVFDKRLTQNNRAMSGCTLSGPPPIGSTFAQIEVKSAN